MFEFLFSPAKITISLEKKEFSIQEKLSGKVEINASKTLKVDSIELFLWRYNNVDHPAIVYDVELFRKNTQNGGEKKLIVQFESGTLMPIPQELVADSKSGNLGSRIIKTSRPTEKGFWIIEKKKLSEKNVIYPNHKLVYDFDLSLPNSLIDTAKSAESFLQASLPGHTHALRSMGAFNQIQLYVEIKLFIEGKKPIIQRKYISIRMPG